MFLLIYIMDSTRCSHGVTSWPSASSSAACCRRRHVCITSYRTSATPLSRTVCDMRDIL